MRRDGGIKRIISDFRKQKFPPARPGSPDQFESAREISFWTHAISRAISAVLRATKVKIAQVICPSGAETVS
jgi:hypothetical protein